MASDTLSSEQQIFLDHPNNPTHLNLTGSGPSVTTGNCKYLCPTSRMIVELLIIVLSVLVRSCSFVSRGSKARFWRFKCVWFSSVIGHRSAVLLFKLRQFVLPTVSSNHTSPAIYPVVRACGGVPKLSRHQHTRSNQQLLSQKLKTKSRCLVLITICQLKLNKKVFFR